MAHPTTLIRQLRALLQLTRTEAQIARVRIAQARTEAVRRELTQNASNADARSRAIVEQLRDLGGVPDVVTPAIGRLTALLKSTVEQVEPLDEALLQDLTLEHQLLDRARYLGVLAETAGKPSVKALADRLVEAHTATVDWLTTVLAEEALGGPAALRATPLQRVAGGVTRLVNLPARIAVESVNQAVNTVSATGDQAREVVVTLAGRAGQTAQQARGKVDQLTGKASQIVGGAAEVATAGRDAALQRAERVAARDGAEGAAKAVHSARRELGALSASELKIKGYEGLTTADAIAAVKALDDAEDIREVLNFEETHKNRSTVVSAAQTRLAAIAKDKVGVDS